MTVFYIIFDDREFKSNSTNPNFIFYAQKELSCVKIFSKASFYPNSWIYPPISTQKKQIAYITPSPHRPPSPEHPPFNLPVHRLYIFPEQPPSPPPPPFHIQHQRPLHSDINNLKLVYTFDLRCRAWGREMDNFDWRSFRLADIRSTNTEMWWYRSTLEGKISGTGVSATLKYLFFFWFFF